MGGGSWDKGGSRGSGPHGEARDGPDQRKASAPGITGPVLPEAAKLSLPQMPGSASNPDNGTENTGIRTKGSENYNNDLGSKSLERQISTAGDWENKLWHSHTT